MTESDWMACTDSQVMLEYLRDIGRLSLRKSRLFGCAACYRIFHLLQDGRSQAAVIVAERYADGLAALQELTTAFDRATDIANLLAHWAKPEDDGFRYAATAASSNAHPDELAEGVAMMVNLAADAFKMDQERKAQSDLVRCLFGNPFHQTEANPVWLAWNDGTVPRIAQAIYEEYAFDRMPILADALEDAGCDNTDILAHCRSEGTHVRGCWVVDLLLGKE